MKIRTGLIALVASFLCVGIANANTLRVVVVQTADLSAYVKSLQEGQALLTKKGSPAHIRAWVARYAGPEAGSVVVSVEYPNLATLAKDDALFEGDPEVRAWLQGLAKIRKIVSDSIYEEAKP